MKWRVVIRSEVERDMAEAAGWYGSKQAGLGAEFVEEVIQVWDALAENPLLNARRTCTKISAGVIPKDFPTASFTKLSKPNKWCLLPPSFMRRGTTAIGKAAFDPFRAAGNPRPAKKTM